MDSERLKEIFREAADAASGLPEDMRQAGFNRALDILLVEAGWDIAGASATDSKSSGSKRSTRRKASKKKVSSEKKRPTPRRRGGRAALRDLVSGDFFKSPRALGEIVSYLETNKALRFTQQHLSPELTTLVRKGELEREKNEKGSYMYRLPRKGG
jgi:hypothetical protein